MIIVVNSDDPDLLTVATNAKYQDSNSFGEVYHVADLGDFQKIPAINANENVF